MLAQLRAVAAAARRKGWMAVCCLLALAACVPRSAEQPVAPPASAPSTTSLMPPPGAQRYTVDAERSVVTIRVYRAGPLARLGHNHVITSSLETGQAWTNGETSGSGFEVRVPVAGLVVDDQAARVAAGPDFASEVPEAAREGTRRNLLRAEVLDAERHPEIVVRASALEGSWKRPVARATVTLKDHARIVTVPLEIERSPGTLRARGDFRIRQTDFGMTPFSVAGGAIQVADEVEVAFDVVARAN